MGSKEANINVRGYGGTAVKTEAAIQRLTLVNLSLPKLTEVKLRALCRVPLGVGTGKVNIRVLKL